MGDIADGIIDGIFDEETGEFIDDDLSMNGGPGYPRRTNKPKKKRKKHDHVGVNNNIIVYNSLPKRHKNN